MMANNYRTDADEAHKIRQFNGTIVMNALAILHNDAKENEITEQITTCTGHPKKRVRHEVRQILDYGVTNGFVVKTRDSYSLPSLPSANQIDSGKKCGGEPSAPSGDYDDDDEGILIELRDADSNIVGIRLPPLGPTYDGSKAVKEIFARFMRSKAEARRMAEDPGAAVDPVVHCVDDEADVTVNVEIHVSPVKKRSHRYSDDDDDEDVEISDLMKKRRCSPEDK